MEGEFPKVTAKYPEIQKDVREGEYGYMVFQVGSIFDEEIYLNQFQATEETINFWNNESNDIKAHDYIFNRLGEQLKAAIEKKKSSKVQLMLDQIANAKWN